MSSQLSIEPFRTAEQQCVSSARIEKNEIGSIGHAFDSPAYGLTVLFCVTKQNLRYSLVSLASNNIGLLGDFIDTKPARESIPAFL